MELHSRGRARTKITWPTGSTACAAAKLRMPQLSSVTSLRLRRIWRTFRIGASSGSLLKKRRLLSRNTSEVRETAFAQKQHGFKILTTPPSNERLLALKEVSSGVRSIRIFGLPRVATLLIFDV